MGYPIDLPAELLGPIAQLAWQNNGSIEETVVSIVRDFVRRQPDSSHVCLIPTGTTPAGDGGSDPRRDAVDNYWLTLCQCRPGE